MSVVSRFAPSPTGLLHLGHAYSAGLSWRRAREAGGQFLLRMEDIDSQRCKPEFAQAATEDLAWLGIEWDGEIRRQSAYLPEYRASLAALNARGLLYPCFCSRRDIANAQAAPHGGEAVYPGTCRTLPATSRAERIAAGQAYTLRLDSKAASALAGPLRFFDEAAGWVGADPLLLGDAILARRDVPTSYHLCVVHDDTAQGVTHIIRGEDLRDATHLHVLLQSLLDLPRPVYAFHKILTDAAGKRLAKRDRAASLRGMREAGMSAAEVWAMIDEKSGAG